MQAWIHLIQSIEQLHQYSMEIIFIGLDYTFQIIVFAWSLFSGKVPFDIFATLLIRFVCESISIKRRWWIIWGQILTPVERLFRFRWLETCCTEHGNVQQGHWVWGSDGTVVSDTVHWPCYNGTALVRPRYNTINDLRILHSRCTHILSRPRVRDMFYVFLKFKVY